MSRILNQIKDAENPVKDVVEPTDLRKKIEEDVLESLSLFQDKVSCLHNRLETLSDSLSEGIILKKS